MGFKFLGELDLEVVPPKFWIGESAKAPFFLAMFFDIGKDLFADDLNN